jgi:methionyl-tRNA formyltransferase
MTATDPKKVPLVFFGTPLFAATQLEHLLANGYQISAVVTAADKLAGRGMTLRASAVKQVALKHGLKVLQPEKLKDTAFINELTAINADVFIVIAFRMLPNEVWKLPRLGTFNLHASLLPQYRGAAPINRAIMSGESTTGLTTFLINEAIDEGNILLQKSMPISENETAGELHDKMMEEGKELVTETISVLASGLVQPIEQQQMLQSDSQQKFAPKIFKKDCQINWNQNGSKVHNHIRGLSPYPAAYTYFTSGQNTTEIKVYIGRFESSETGTKPGAIITDSKTFLKIAVIDGFYQISYLQQAGKKAMPVTEFLKGFRFVGTFFAHNLD